LRKSIAALVLSLALLGASLPARANDDDFKSHKIEHVQLISVDGLHALDLSNYVAAHPYSTLASLSKHGYAYTNASTSNPSDSPPGLASLVTGGSPTTTGRWYDVTFNRALSPQAQGNSVMGTGRRLPRHHRRHR
jgi:predicted AlkP superfamily pyrophosphatase or phosphodiesterase